MRNKWMFAFVFLAATKSYALPNIICDYGKTKDTWELMGAATNYIDGDEKNRGLDSVSTSETFGPLVGELSGVCVSLPIDTGNNTPILKFATYSSLGDFQMDNDCEFISNGSDYKTWSRFKVKPTEGAKNETGTGMLWVVNYFPTKKELKTWNQSGAIAQDEAEKKCQSFLPSLPKN
jgi:hypothetical protein